VTLSDKAIKDLRIALRKSYGGDFDIDLSDEQINRIGMVTLACLVEGLKLEIRESSKQV
jgi:hypothetical protein